MCFGAILWSFLVVISVVNAVYFMVIMYYIEILLFCYNEEWLVK